MKLFKIIWCLIFGHKVMPVRQDIAYWLAIDGKRVVTCERCRFVVEDGDTKI